MSAGGLIQPSTHFQSARLWPYRTLQDSIRFGLECAYVLGTIVFLGRLLYFVGRRGNKIGLWTVVVELGSIALHLCTTVAWGLFVQSPVRTQLQEAVSSG